MERQCRTLFVRNISVSRVFLDLLFSVLKLVLKLKLIHSLKLNLNDLNLISNVMVRSKLGLI